MFTVGFTGTSSSLTNYGDPCPTIIQKRRIVKALTELYCPDAIAVHGDCIGADAFFATVATQLGYYVIARPGCDFAGRSPKRAFAYCDTEYPPELYLDRNHKIVDQADMMLATPKEDNEELRSGTWATIRYAKKTNKPIEIIYPVF